MRLRNVDGLSFIFEIQEDIDLIEREVMGWGEGVSSDTLERKSQIVEHFESMVKILYLLLRERLEIVQSNSMKRNRREMIIEEYFRPPQLLSTRHLQTKGSTANVAVNEPKSMADSKSDQLESEAATLLATYKTDIDQVVNVRRGIQEISTVLSLLSSRASEQDELATSVLGTANDSIGYIDNAEEQLKKAIEHNSGYRFYIVLWFMILGMILLIMDFFM